MKASAKPFILIAAGASGAASLIYLSAVDASVRFGVRRHNARDRSRNAHLRRRPGYRNLDIGPVLADRRPHSTLTAFAAIQLATGLYGFASLWLFHGVEALYLATYPSFADHANLLAVVQFVLIALVILPPAILMGGSLPLLARRLVSSGGGFVSSVGSVYAGTRSVQPLALPR